MSTGVIFILGKGVSPILASGVKSTWPQGSSAPGFSTYCYFRSLRHAGNLQNESIRRSQRLRLLFCVVIKLFECHILFVFAVFVFYICDMILLSRCKDKHV